MWWFILLFFGSFLQMFFFVRVLVVLSGFCFSRDLFVILKCFHVGFFFVKYFPKWWFQNFERFFEALLCFAISFDDVKKLFRIFFKLPNQFIFKFTHVKPVSIFMAVSYNLTRLKFIKYSQTHREWGGGGYSDKGVVVITLLSVQFELLPS